MWAKLALPLQCLLHERALFFSCIATAWKSFLKPCIVVFTVKKGKKKNLMITALPFSLLNRWGSHYLIKETKKKAFIVSMPNNNKYI